ncbi:putative CENPB DNA-binding domain-containing protein 1 [Xylocopa sonorina]|uniref:putative CENPB DNA-binding domain-containing protein 1 n=1 Tax=Xylocopa sonorina TaxID=1818115 RepID=UPI00403AA72E
MNGRCLQCLFDGSAKIVSTVSSETKKIQLKRKFISLEEKIQILDRLQDGERVSSVAKSYNLNEATVRTIKNSEQKIRKNVAEGCPLRAKRVARTRDIDVVRMEHALIIWMEDCLEKRIPLNGNTIRQKALQIYKHLKENGQSSTNRQIHSFCASKGWLERLKARFSLRNNELQRRRTSEDGVTAITIKVEPPEILETGEYTAD